MPELPEVQVMVDWLKANVKMDKVVRPGDFISREAEHCHQVKLFNDKPAWTLVFLGLKRRGWCFVTAAGPVLWKQYLNVWNDESPYDRVGTDPNYKSGV